MSYYTQLSPKAQCVVRQYTGDYSTQMNMYLVRNNGLESDTLSFNFSEDIWEKIALLTSVIVNAPVGSTTVYHHHKRGFLEKTYSGDKILGENANDIITTYFKSTTNSIKSREYLSPFKDIDCCQREITLTNFPIFRVGQDSSYSDQDEVILPPNILYRINNRDRIIIDEYPEDIVKKCTKQTIRKDLFPNCPGGNNNYDIDKTCLSNKQSQLVDTDYGSIESTYIDRKIIDKINIILEKYYKCEPGKSFHGKLHICNTILLSILLLTEITNNFENHLEATIFSSLFHDAGRKCRDGPDKWEADSARIAMEELGSDVVYQNIIGRSQRFSYYAYKGADSIEIGRVKRYKMEINPLYRRFGENVQNLISQTSLHDDFIALTYYLHNIERGEESYTDVFVTNKILNGRIRFTAHLDIFPGYVLDSVERDYPITRDRREKIENKLINGENAQDTLVSMNSMCEYFISKGYLRDENRYFDDYYEIVLAFLPLLPTVSRLLPRVVIPFKHRDL